MIKSLFMKNFRGFKGEHVVPLGKLTLLYGPNSSGKSSVLQALKLMANTLEDDMVNPLASLPFNRNNFMNGTFESNINDKDLEKEMGLGFSSLSNNGFLGDENILEDLKIGCRIFYNHTSKIGALGDWKSAPFDAKGLSSGRYSENLIRRFALIYEGSNCEHSVVLENGRAPSREVLGPIARQKGGRTKWERDVSNSLNNEYSSFPKGGLFFHLNCVLRFVTMIKVFIAYRCDLDLLKLSNSSKKFKAERNNIIAFHESTMNALDRPEFIEILEQTNWTIETRGRLFGRTNDSFSIEFDPQHIVALVPQEDEEILNGLYVVNQFVDELNKKFRELETSKYIGPIRAIPKRYAVVNDLPEQRGFFDRGAEFPYTGISQGEMNQVNKWFNILGIPYTLGINETGNEYTGPIVTPTVKHTKTGTVLTLAEVGFGISQVLPILGCLSDYNQPTYIEQPEIHLHPKMQAGLADFFIERILQKFDFLGNEICNDKDSSNNEASKDVLSDTIDDPIYDSSPWIIETHSESLMLRLQRRIREGVISHEDISVVYIGYIEGEGSVVVPLRLNEDGEFIDEWPGGFFEENFDDVFGSELS